MCRESIISVSVSTSIPASAPPSQKAGSTAAAGMTRAPTGRYPVLSTTASPRMQLTVPHSGKASTRAAQVTVTPLPPWKPLQKGKLWPRAAPSPAYRTARRPRSGASSRRHRAQARAVLSRSPASTRAPAPFPSAPAMLAMPGFPLPSVRAPRPVFHRATTSAVSRQPQTYPAARQIRRSIFQKLPSPILWVVYPIPPENPPLFVKSVASPPAKCYSNVYGINRQAAYSCGHCRNPNQKEVICHAQ